VIIPSKLASLRPDRAKPFDPRDVVKLNQKLGVAPADSICEGCVMTFVHARRQQLRPRRGAQSSTDGDTTFCQIFLSNDGVVIDECGRVSP
jgi:hypothetical protein